MNALINGIAAEYVELTNKISALEIELKNLNVEFNNVEKSLMDAMVDEGVNSVDLEGLGKFSIQTKNYLNCNAANKPTMFEYLKESGNGALIKEDVNARTLQAFLREHLEELKKNYIADDPSLDDVDAREKAVEFLKTKGAAYFSEKKVAFKKG